MSVWTYNSKTGVMTNPKGEVVATGYSGNGAGLNNPEMEAVHNVGPIPRGMWKICLTPLEHTDVGPLALALSPVGDTDSYGRSLFRIHGDNSHMNHSASHGCVIMPRGVRQSIIYSRVPYLHVIVQ